MFVRRFVCVCVGMQMALFFEFGAHPKCDRSIRSILTYWTYGRFTINDVADAMTKSGANDDSVWNVGNALSKS